LISEYGCDPSEKGKFGGFVLHAASYGGDVDLVQTLISKYKGDVNAHDFKQVPLHVSACNGKLGVVSLMLRCGANINVLNSKGWSL